MRLFQLASLTLVALSAACHGDGATAVQSTQGAPEGAGSAHQAGVIAPRAHAEIGQPAPDFTLSDTEGHPFHLADAKGKTVVLEWFNPGCPFVRASHTKGSLRDAAKRHSAEGVVWLGVNSAAPGNQGYGAEATREGKNKYGLDHPILLDESGDVGHAFGATNTPHLFVIDASGTLVYRGAVDNSPDGEGESPTDGKLVSYVDAALADLAAGRPVAVPSTKAYGCSVKYARP
jgi:peroxiredoxin